MADLFWTVVVVVLGALTGVVAFILGWLAGIVKGLVESLDHAKAARALIAWLENLFAEERR